MSFTGRMNITGVPPLTGGLLSSNAGGYRSRNFVGTGHSVVEVVGRSDERLASRVTDERVEFEALCELEGAGVREVTDARIDVHRQAATSDDWSDGGRPHIERGVTPSDDRVSRSVPRTGAGPGERVTGGRSNSRRFPPAKSRARGLPRPPPSRLHWFYS